VKYPKRECIHQKNVTEQNGNHMVAPRVADVRRRTTMLDITTLLEKGIPIPDPGRFMWIQTKQDYDKHVERLEN